MIETDRLILRAWCEDDLLPFSRGCLIMNVNIREPI